jgi:ribosomal protein S18 acetylase RimI-like enzyme
MFNYLDYSIRKTKFEDLEQVVNVNIKSWCESYQYIIDQSTINNLNLDEAFIRRQKNFIENPNLISYVALYQDRIIGFCDAGALRDHPFRRKNEAVKQRVKGEIFALYILNDHKGKKLGKALIEKVMNDFHDQNLYPFAIFALKDNLSGRRFYEKLGGQLVAEGTITIDDKDYAEVIYLFE